MNGIYRTSLKTTFYGLHNFFYFYKATIWSTKFLVDAEDKPTTDISPEFLEWEQ